MKEASPADQILAKGANEKNALGAERKAVAEEVATVAVRVVEEAEVVVVVAAEMEAAEKKEGINKSDKS